MEIEHEKKVLYHEKLGLLSSLENVKNISVNKVFWGKIQNTKIKKFGGNVKSIPVKFGKR